MLVNIFRYAIFKIKNNSFDVPSEIKTPVHVIGTLCLFFSCILTILSLSNEPLVYATSKGHGGVVEWSKKQHPLCYKVSAAPAAL